MACVIPPDFPVYDALGYTGKPSLAETGMGLMKLIGVSWFPGHLASHPERLPRDCDIQYVMCKATNSGVNPQKLIFDIEHWLVDDPTSPPKYEYVLNRAKALQPTYDIGIWQTAPWNLKWSKFLSSMGNPASPEMIEFEAVNATLQGVADIVDVLYPALYTFTSDFSLWKQQADIMMAKSRQMANGKPVMPFLLPQPTPPSSNGTQLWIDGTMWRKQLEYLYTNADGAVLWGYYGIPMNVTDGWWVETMDFMGSFGGGIV